MATNPLLQHNNPFLRKTEWTPRPARNDPSWRYVDEGRLVEAQDFWDRAENHRREVDQNVAQLTAKAKLRDAEAERVRHDREDKVIDDELIRRYLAGGGSEHAFITNRMKIRADFALEVAIGRAEPIAPSLEQTKAELRRLRGHRLAQPDPRP